jgi:poly(hydroxyalkanoate) depolymerase family esterase
MNPLFQRLMQNAARLTRSGDLRAATAAIKAALAGESSAPPPPPSQAAANDSNVVDVVAREHAAPPPTASALPQAGSEPLPRPAPQPQPQPAGTGEFVAGHFAGPAGARDYKLFIPPAAGTRPLPLIVMLHGCTQDPDDFAAGTCMNDAALMNGFFVLYPAQSQQANPHRCWNWFKHNHQMRGRGEPELLAQMTRDVMDRHAVDPARVYVAGLSAGGAMAAILGDAYPDLFAAVGVHSGLPTGIAKDVSSALGAMKRSVLMPSGVASGVATIVFHGDADATVHPGNGEHVVTASAGLVEAVVEKGHAGRGYTRKVLRNTAGEVVAEHWVVHGAQHAWSGGNPRGSYADPSGPDATREMVRFFMEHPHRTVH